MALLWVLFVLLHLVSLGFTLTVLWRLYEYYKRYHFHESKYTLLFGFIHVGMVKAIYVILVFLWVITSFFAFIRF